MEEDKEDEDEDFGSTLGTCLRICHPPRMPPSDAHISTPGGPRDFATTQWSLVLHARGDSAGARTALARLCEAYWYPLYGFVRRHGHPPHDAQDLTQDFCARL